MLLSRRLGLLVMLVLGLALPSTLTVRGEPAAAETDLDKLMRQVLERRDDNWRKLQQYVLDEREQVELFGPSETLVWGERHDYTWYIRNGFFVRSPIRFNGVSIGDADRRKYEEDYLRRAERRDRRGGQPAPSENPAELDGLIRQTRQPQFVSSAYFLRFRFEEGKYAFVGHERLDGRDVLRIEYYPTKMFTGTDRRRGSGSGTEQSKAHDAAFQRLMNKVALITLWVEPRANQIVKYTFDNIAFDFLPVPWLVHIDELKATMTMGRPFPDVWLPQGLKMTLGLTSAAGRFDVRYALDYHDYRRADVTTKITVPGAR